MELHVVGSDAAQLKSSLRCRSRPASPAKAEPMTPTLEDIFIDTMTQAGAESEQ